MDNIYILFLNYFRTHSPSGCMVNRAIKTEVSTSKTAFVLRRLILTNFDSK